MNDEDRKYLRSAEKARPSLEVFQGMVQILSNTHERIDRLMDAINNSLLEASEPIRA